MDTSGYGAIAPLDYPPYRHVREMWSTHLIVEGGGELFKIPYSVDGTTVAFGKEKKVTTQYVELSRRGHEGEFIDLSNSRRRAPFVVDLVASAAYPGLERKPGGPDNWVEAVGGLPSYIERIAKHLHYEQGYSISRAIAAAVNTVKRWAAGGTVAPHGDPNHKRVSPATQAKAAKALAEWEAKKARARASRGKRRDLATATSPVGSRTIDLALTKDGRKSYKNRGKWKHGFVPADEEAITAKAKGSPIAKKRIKRIYGEPSKAVKKSRATDKAKDKAKGSAAPKPNPQPKPSPKPNPRAGNAPGQITSGRTIARGVKVSTRRGQSERVKDIGQLRNVKPIDTKRTQRTAARNVANQRKIVRRSSKAWEDIPEAQKTIRNGKRYTLTTYRGKQQLTEWFGPNYNEQETGDIGTRKLVSVRSSQLQQMTTAQLRRLLRVPGQPKAVRKAIYKMIAEKMEKRKHA